MYIVCVTQQTRPLPADHQVGHQRRLVRRGAACAIASDEHDRVRFIGNHEAVGDRETRGGSGELRVFCAGRH